MIRTKQSLSSRKKSESVFCNYSHHNCMQNHLEGYDYCIKHILEDKNAPFKQCHFVSSKNGKRCTNAAPKVDKKDGYCGEHNRKAAMWRQKASRKRKPSDDPETVLQHLDYYRPGSSKQPPEVVPSQAGQLIEYASDSDSDREATLVDQAWRGDADSDADSVDSEYEDPLKHAGVYTAEEVALITRDKLIRLQSLYIDQFKRLQHVLKEKRRKFLSSQKVEQETIGKSIGKVTDPKEKRKMKKLQALKSYRKRRGKEALLYQQSRERRITATPDYYNIPPKPIKPPKCINVEKGVHCNNKVMPYTKHCQRHILNDPYQVLYQTCNDDSGCSQPVFTVDTVACNVHRTLPEHTNRWPPQIQDSGEEAQAIDVEGPDQDTPSESIKDKTSETVKEESQSILPSQSTAGQEQDVKDVENTSSSTATTSQQEDNNKTDKQQQQQTTTTTTTTTTTIKEDKEEPMDT